MATATSEHIRDRVDAFLRDADELLSTPLPADQFFQAFLDRLVPLLEARAAAVWMIDRENCLGLLVDRNLSEAGFFEDLQATKTNQRLLSESLQAGEPLLHPFGSTRESVLLFPVANRDRLVGIIEVFGPTGGWLVSSPADVQAVEAVFDPVIEYLQRQEEDAATIDPERFLHELLPFAGRLHASLDPKEIAAIAANDGRKLLGCDRLSIVLRRGGRTEVANVSGQAHVNPRANQVRLLAALAERVMDSKTSFTFAGSPDDLPPQLIQPLSDYILESGSRFLLIVPLLPPNPIQAENSQPLSSTSTARRGPALPSQAFGALIIEQFKDGRPRPQLEERAKLVARQVEIALTNGLAHQQVLLLPLRRFLGRQLARLHGRRLAQLLVATLILACVSGGLIAIPADYRVEGRGRLMPATRREALAPRNGEVVEIFVTNGDRVEAGTKLLQLRNDELQTQLLASRNRLSEQRQLQQTLRAEFDEASRSGSRPEWIRLRGKLTQIKSEIEGEVEQVQMLEAQEEQLTVRAPIAGTVTTFQPQQLLINRPVQRGEALVEVMDETGPWRLELNVPEYRMGHLLAAQSASKTPLPVEYVLAAAPEAHYPADLEQIATRSAISAREGSIVEVYAAPAAAPNGSPLPGELPAAHRRIGADVQAKIQCGRRSLAYVLFGDVVEFVQKQLWF